MNLLFTTTSYPPAIGGTQLLMHQLARQLSAQHTIQVVTQWDAQRTDWLLGTTLIGPRTPGAYTVDGVPVQRIVVPMSARARLAPWVLAYYAVQGAALERITNVLEQELAPFTAQVDLIHNARIGREGLSFASFRLARKRDVPFVFTPVHHPRWGGWLHRHYQALYRQADAVLVLTEVEKQTLAGLGVDERRLHVTGMGPVLAGQADGGRFRAMYGLGDTPLVLFLGQKYPYKGIGAVLDATRLVWRRFPEAKFAFVGPRTTYSRLRFAAVSDARILELDAVSLQDKTDALAACDVLCVPSSQESFGGVLAEAWSLGKPVIAGDIPAVRGLVEEGQDGFLVRRQGGEVAERLIWLLDHPAAARQMGQLGCEKIAARYSWPRLADLTEAVYRDVLGQRA